MNQTTEKEKPKRWKLVLLGLLMILLAGMTVANIQRGLTSQIYLYGEEHSQQRILDEELEIWGGYYARGMRDLFVEFPYFDAQFLNLWMKADDDELLNLQFQDWQGTQGGTEVMKNFLKQIKERYPETVFHGTDVGHTWKSTGARYLAYLEANGQNDTAEYQRVLENIEQGKTYYATRQTDSDAADAYRENKMVENFERSYQELEAERRADIMGIYGAAHIASSYSRPKLYGRAAQRNLRRPGAYGRFVNADRAACDGNNHCERKTLYGLLLWGGGYLQDIGLQDPEVLAAGKCVSGLQGLADHRRGHGL